MYSNKDNYPFYLNMAPEEYEAGALLPSGLYTSVDVTHLIELLSNLPYSVTSCLEIGSGQGRVIDGILKNLDPAPRIFAVERSPNFIEILSEKYKDNKGIVIINDDVFNASLPNADITLIMFSLICEFNRGEQRLLIEKLHNNTEGALILDLPSPETAKVREKTELTADGEYICHGSRGNKLYLNLPSEKDLTEMQISAGFRCLTKHPYSTITGMIRDMYVFHK